jgi:Tol biopolymer transport system component
MDEHSLELSGAPVTIAEQVVNDPSFNLAVFSASQTGVLTFQSGVTRAGAPLLLVDRTGKQTGTLGDLAEQFRPRFSPDDKKVVSSFFDIRTFRLNIWAYDIASGAHNRVTNGAGEDFPVWSPDGARIVYAHRSAGQRQSGIFMKTLAESGGEELVYAPTEQVIGSLFGPTDWSRDGSTILVSGTRYEVGTSDIMAVSASGTHVATPFLKTEFGECDARFSPDGHWVAYMSNESGDNEVYLRRFGATDNRLWKVSNSGGGFPRWGKSGEDLLYVTKENKLMQATLKYSADGVAVTSTKGLFTMPPFLEDYDVSHDGATIVINRYLEVRKTSPVTIVNNWVEGLKKE